MEGSRCISAHDGSPFALKASNETVHTPQRNAQYRDFVNSRRSGALVRLYRASGGSPVRVR